MERLKNYFMNDHWQVIKFILVGISTFFIYFFSFHFFFGITHLDYRIAASIAYVFTISSHFLMHRIFTFSASEQNLGANIWRYILMLVLNYSIMLLSMWFIVNIIRSTPYLGLIVSTVLTAIISFFTMKHFVFEESRLNLT